MHKAHRLLRLHKTGQRVKIWDSGGGRPLAQSTQATNAICDKGSTYVSFPSTAVPIHVDGIHADARALLYHLLPCSLEIRALTEPLHLG